MAADVRILIQAVDDATKQLEQVTNGATRLFNAFGGLKGLMVGGLGFGAVYAGVSKALGAFNEGQEAISALNLALRNSGQFSTEAATSMGALADSLAATTKFTDEEAMKAEALLINIGRLNTEGIQQLLPSIADMASAMGMDLEQATMAVAKAATGNVTALQKMGLELDGTAPRARLLADIQEQLTTRFGGAGQAAVETWAGKIGQAKKNTDELLESAGGFIATHTGLGTAVETVADSFQWLNDKIKTTNEGMMKMNSETLKIMQAQLAEVMTRATVTKLGFQGMADAVTFATQEDKYLYDSLSANIAKLEKTTTATNQNTLASEENARAKKSQDAALEKEAEARQKVLDKIAEEQEKEVKAQLEKDLKLLDLQSDFLEKQFLALGESEEEKLNLKKEWILAEQNANLQNEEIYLKSAMAIMDIDNQLAALHTKTTGKMEKDSAKLGTSMMNTIGASIGQLISGAQTLGDVMKNLFASGLSLLVQYLLGGTPMGGFAGGLIQNLFQGFQTNPGQVRVVPGSPFQAMPAMLHGGETVGRGAGSGLVINVAGNIYNEEDTMEIFRAGLVNLKLRTGRVAV